MVREEVHVHPENGKPLVVGDKVFKSSNDFELTENELEKARIELGETEEKKERCLRELKEKLSKDESANYCTDDTYLLRYLRYRKYDTESAYQNLKKFYRLRKKHPDFFVIPPHLKSLLDKNIITHLPYTDEEGRTICLGNIDKWNPDETSFEELAQSVTAIFDVTSMNPKCQINGIIPVWDANGMNTKQFTEFLKNNRMITTFTFMTNVYPWRINKVIVVNTGRIVQLLNRMIRPFISKKIADRVIFLGSDMSELHQYVNPVLLPKKLGGTLDEEESKITHHIMHNLPYLRYERSYV